MGSMGVSALRKHANGMNHRHLVHQARGLQILNQQTMCGSSNTVIGASSTSTLTEDDPSVAVLDDSTTARPGFVSTETRKAEILWALQVVYTHQTFNSTAQLGELFETMFPDSAIAAGYACGPDKTKYNIKYGLAPYFFRQLCDIVKCCDFYVLGFDESLNRQIQEGQMDNNVNF